MPLGTPATEVEGVTVPVEVEGAGVAGVTVDGVVDALGAVGLGVVAVGVVAALSVDGDDELLLPPPLTLVRIRNPTTMARTPSTATCTTGFSLIAFLKRSSPKRKEAPTCRRRSA